MLNLAGSVEFLHSFYLNKEFRLDYRTHHKNKMLFISKLSKKKPYASQYKIYWTSFFLD